VRDILALLARFAYWLALLIGLLGRCAYCLALLVGFWVARFIGSCIDCAENGDIREYFSIQSHLDTRLYTLNPFTIFPTAMQEIPWTVTFISFSLLVVMTLKASKSGTFFLYSMIFKYFR